MTPKLEKLVRLVADGRHNAFTCLARFRGALYLTYRSSDGHAATDGAVELLRSRDEGESWERLSAPFRGDRNYYEGFMVECGGRLYMFAGAYEADRPVKEQLASAYVSVSDDGESWSPVAPAGEPHWRFWHPIEIDGVIFTARYRLASRERLRPDGTFPAEDWTVELVRSTDGVNWDHVSTISRNESGNETALLWDGELLTAFTRRENRPCTMAVRRAAPPFAVWSEVDDFGECVQGAAVKSCDGRHFLFGRRRAASPAIGTIYYDRSKISVRGYLYCPEIDSWADYLSLPGAHDCAYPGLLELGGGRMLVSYYSQHAYENSDINSAADIYLATVRTDGAPEWGAITGHTAGILKKAGIL